MDKAPPPRQRQFYSIWEFEIINMACCWRCSKCSFRCIPITEQNHQQNDKGGRGQGKYGWKIDEITNLPIRRFIDNNWFKGQSNENDNFTQYKQRKRCVPYKPINIDATQYLLRHTEKPMAKFISWFHLSQISVSAPNTKHIYEIILC